LQSWGIQRFFQGQPAIRRKSSAGSLTGIIRRISSGVGVSVSRTASIVRTASRYTIAEELLPRTTSRYVFNSLDPILKLSPQNQYQRHLQGIIAAQTC